MDSLTPSEQRDLEQRLQKRQVKEFMSLFGNLVDNCFTACVDDFTSKALSGREGGCIQRCVAKSMTTQTRLSERFAELNQAMTAEMQNKRF
ncbi:mitochondrial import inner membrane translocase subunit tim-9 [Cercophora newfieldiana]|uniref:Mitochondrial import inner membrane translocase subunit n=1 Tax=Cercophora newfieldiana TaxID=92897 RepID=A0AA40CPM1_9PEZI|nr:mitochondrial import inner membrane translocase subunit tim-9 [Cercophora newfieldiana]